MLDLGPLPLAGDFQATPGRNALYPLAIDRCDRCGLLQIRQTVDPSLLFGPAYSYASSTVPGLVRHFSEYAREVAPARGSKPLLLEIGCNDGVFLAPLARAGYNVVGIDASDNVAALARARGLDVWTGFFEASTAEALRERYGQFDVVTCSNVFAHNPDLDGMLRAVSRVLNPKTGEFWIEVHSAEHLFAGLQWDCFYHEHCFYWTIHALTRCLARASFMLAAYKFTQMHGGALRALFRKGSRGQAEIAEHEISADHWQEFGSRCHRSRQQIRASIQDLGIDYAYGAAGRAVTLINWSGIAESLKFVVDGSPLRFGKYIPNTSVPIISEGDFFGRGDPGRLCFVTAHNYLADIREKVKRAFPSVDLRFVTPLPDVRIE